MLAKVDNHGLGRLKFSIDIVLLYPKHIILNTDLFRTLLFGNCDFYIWHCDNAHSEASADRCAGNPSVRPNFMV